MPTTNPVQPSPRRPLIRDARLAWAIWAVYALIIAGEVARKQPAIERTDGTTVVGTIIERTPEVVRVRTDKRALDGSRETVAIPTNEIVRIAPRAQRSVTPEYRRAAELWWRSKTLYTEGVHGFLYMPQAAIAFSPFAILPDLIGETLWRWIGLAAYAVGLWRLCRSVFSPTQFALVFTIATILAIPAAIGSAVNGQTNLVLGGLFALAAADLIHKRWWVGTLWLMLALACKPTALVMILLVGAVYLRPMSWRLAVGLAVFALVPFLHPDPAYVVEQYHLCFTKMAAAAAPTDRFQDIRGMLMDFGINAPDRVLTVVRAVAALAALGLCLLASRRFTEPVRAVYLLSFAMIYLMLFNPRTEGVSYAMLGIPAALCATGAILDRRWLVAVPLIFLCLILQFSRQITGSQPNYWVRPVVTIVFGAYLITRLVRMRGILQPRLDSEEIQHGKPTRTTQKHQGSPG